MFPEGKHRVRRTTQSGLFLENMTFLFENLKKRSFQIELLFCTHNLFFSKMYPEGNHRVRWTTESGLFLQNMTFFFGKSEKRIFHIELLSCNHNLFFPHIFPRSKTLSATDQNKWLIR